MSEAVFIGIDVSRDTLEVGSSAKATTWRHGNDSAGIEALTAELLALAPELVVLEATGGYEFEAACTLQAAGLTVADDGTGPHRAPIRIASQNAWPESADSRSPNQLTQPASR